jgi:hypothetical protein
MVRPENVFINCPFDNDFFPLLKSLLFTLIYMDLKPQISETSDSGEVRLNKIKELMTKSMYSIHDLSRMEVLKKREYPRFNMPFECGIDFGLRMSNEEDYSQKKFLILEKEQYRYQKVLSDISGNDIKSHKNDPETLIKGVRDWFRIAIGAKKVSYKEIWLAYNEFVFDNDEILKAEGYNPNDINALPFSEVIENMTEWINQYKIKVSAF